MKTRPSSTPPTKLVWFLLDLHDSRLRIIHFRKPSRHRCYTSAGSKYWWQKTRVWRLDFLGQNLQPWIWRPLATSFNSFFPCRVSGRSLARAILAHHPLSCHDTLTCTPNGRFWQHASARSCCPLPVSTTCKKCRKMDLDGVVLLSSFKRMDSLKNSDSRTNIWNTCINMTS